MPNENIGIEGKATQFPHNDATKGGRNPSIKRQIKQLLEADGQLKIDSVNVLKINDDGSVIIKVPTEMQIAMKLKQWAMSKKGTDSIKAIQMITEQIDGKPKQMVGFEMAEILPIITRRISDKND